MLSPRDFLEDCIRFGKMDFWATGIPWEVVNSCIDTNFNFVPSQNAMEDFERQVGQSWDNLQGPLAKVIPCPQDKSPINCPWTTIYTLSEYFTRKDRQQNIEATLSGQGFAEEDFRAICSTCNTVITHDYLRVQRFRMEAQDMTVHGYPMSGTVLSILNGTPIAPAGVLDELTRTGTTKEIIRLIDFRIAEKDGLTSMGDIKDSIQDAISGKTIMGKSSPALSTMTDEVQLVLRRIMSRYWDNHSIFAHDLVGAVIRQGSFIKQMNEIHWLGTPTREYTLFRILQKYDRFFQMMETYPSKAIVPTLDIDLAWHTDQLSPAAYYKHCMNTTKVFMDHDDKVEEKKLSDAFEWTCEAYQHMFGERYSQCNCWYCEAVAELASLPVPDATTLEKGPHISAHNSVRVVGISCRVASADMKLTFNTGRREQCSQRSAGGGAQGQRISAPRIIPTGMRTRTCSRPCSSRRSSHSCTVPDGSKCNKSILCKQSTVHDRWHWGRRKFCRRIRSLGRKLKWGVSWTMFVMNSAASFRMEPGLKDR